MMAEIFLKSVQNYGFRNFIKYHDGTKIHALTYQEGAEVVFNLICFLEEKGLGPQDRVLWYNENMLSSVLFYLACSFCRIIPVPLSPSFSHEYMKNMADSLQASVIFDSSFDLNPFLNRKTPDSLQKLGELAKKVLPEDIVAILPTSGTTGVPKLPLRNNFMISRIAEIMVRDFEMKSEPVQEALFPNALTHSFSFGLFPAVISVGGCLCLASLIDTKTPLLEVLELNPTSLIATPRVLISLYKQSQEQNLEKKFGSRLKYILTAGAALPKDLYQAFESQGISVLEWYASTETSLIAKAFRRPSNNDFIWKAFDDVKIKQDSNGVLAVKSPGLMPGYFKNSSETVSARTADGYFETNDIVEFNSQGYFRILGRAEEAFSTPEGSYVYPARIENMLESLPWVSQVLLIGDQKPSILALLVIKNQKGVSSGVADGFITWEKYAEINPQASKDLEKINKNLEPLEQIKKVLIFTKSFPKELYTVAGNGKIKRSRAELIKYYEARIAYEYAH